MQIIKQRKNAVNHFNCDGLRKYQFTLQNWNKKHQILNSISYSI
jgi:hypothetical protein